MKDHIINDLDKIISELKKGNDIQIKPTKDGIKIQTIKVKTLS